MFSQATHVHVKIIILMRCLYDHKVNSRITRLMLQCNLLEMCACMHLIGTHTALLDDVALLPEPSVQFYCESEHGLIPSSTHTV